MRKLRKGESYDRTDRPIFTSNNTYKSPKSACLNRLEDERLKHSKNARTSCLLPRICSKSALIAVLSGVGFREQKNRIAKVLDVVVFNAYKNMAFGHKKGLVQLSGEQYCQEPPTRNILDSLKPTAYSLLLIFVSMFSLSDAWAQSVEIRTAERQQNQIQITGVVRSATVGEPLQGVSIRADKQQTVTDKDGQFKIQTEQQKGTFEVKHLGYKTQRITFGPRSTFFNIQLERDESYIEEVEVVSTGYQKIPRERVTGSFEFVDSALFNRKVSTDFISRLEDVVPSISSLKVYPENKGRLLGINIRGVSTMGINPWPLVVVDGVPYPNNYDLLNGYFMNINPNDIENVTVLKDASAASIWGAQSGNGVIVITTKRGKYNQPFQLGVNSSVSIAQKPDLYYYPQMNASDYIDLEKELFDKGYWNSRMNQYYQNLTPVIQLLKQNREGTITEAEMNRELDRLRMIDGREDYLKYIYRAAINQQYNVQLRGGGEKVNTMFSIGIDNNKNELVTSSYQRFTAKNNTQLRPIDGLTIDLGLTYTESKRKDSFIQMGYNMMSTNFPYLQLADADGNALVVDGIPNNPVFRDTVAGGRLLDWKYRPLDELFETSQTTWIRETFLNFAGTYQVLPSLTASLQYAYQRASQPSEGWRGMGSVHQREFINNYTSWNRNAVTWNMPIGDYMAKMHRQHHSHQGRAQLGYNNTFGGRHALDAIAGFEMREMKAEMMSKVFHGYDKSVLSYQRVAHGVRVPSLNGIAGNIVIPDFSQLDGYVNRYQSLFFNGSYTLDSRYLLSGSFRKDASNLFGVRTNERGQPFWSAGLGWVLSEEDFINSDWFSLLKARLTYGYNGNVNNTTAAYPIINVSSSAHYMTGQRYAMMQSPPNPDLRWERVGMLNAAIDFRLKNDRVKGTVEYYIKRPKDLIAAAAIDPTSGFNELNVNSANLDGRGVDISLNTVNWETNSFNWTSDIVFSYNRTKVIKSYISDRRASMFVGGPNGMLMTPIEGMDLYSQLTYKWAGLDPTNGMPQGYENGEISTNYSTLVNGSLVEDLENHGSVTPLYFGSFRNNFRYKRLEMSFNISYQLGHTFMRRSFNNRFFIDGGVGHADYAKRWQKPGDEAWTNVPVFTYPNNLYASQFYYYSSALVEPADQIKLRDIQLVYNLPQKLGVKNARVYAYAKNIGTIWRANKLGIDPEYGDAFPEPFTMSLGLNFNL